MKALCIEAKREGYSPDQIRHTLTVGELIELLSEFDENTPVYTRHDGGYTFGGITEAGVRVRIYEEEEE